MYMYIYIYIHRITDYIVLRIAILFVPILQRSVEILIQDGRSFAIIDNYCYDLILCDTMGNMHMYVHIDR